MLSKEKKKLVNIVISIAPLLVIMLLVQLNTQLWYSGSTFSENVDSELECDLILQPATNQFASQLSPLSKFATGTPHSQIRIIGNGNFSIENGVISGVGTQQDPFIIANWDIESLDGFAPIYIEGTTSYFIIENCTVYNGGANPYGAGIYFSNVEHGKLINNTVINNSYYGINIYDSTDIEIKDNTVVDNLKSGILVYQSDANLVEGNDIETSAESGIFIYYGDTNLVQNNSVINNAYGIRLDQSNLNSINNNMITDNTHFGINLVNNANENLVIGNIVSSNTDRGISLGNNNINNLFQANIIFNSTNDGIYIDATNSYNNFTANVVRWSGSIGIENRANSSVFYNNTISNSGYSGLNLYRCHYNEIVGNIIANHTYQYGGLYGYVSSTNLISNNLVINNTVGIRLDDDSSNNTIYNNQVCDSTGYAIRTGNSFFNNLSNNIFTNNVGGLLLSGGGNHSVNQNTINQGGIDLVGTLENRVTQNNIKSCIYGIRMYSSAHNNSIADNVIYGNYIGISIELSSADNYIYSNWLWNNTITLIDYVDDNFIEVSNYFPIPDYQDTDGDGLTDVIEIELGTDFLAIDTDQDGFSDGFEVYSKTDPLNDQAYPELWQSDIESLLTLLNGNYSLLNQVVMHLEDNATLIQTVLALANQNSALLTQLNGTHIADLDAVITVIQELELTIGDLDCDGLSDVQELALGTNLSLIDTDCDNLNDAFEIKIGTDPLDDDSDADTYLDGIEVMQGTDPLNKNDYPGAPSSTSSESTSSDSSSTSSSSSKEARQNAAGYTYQLTVGALCVGLLLFKRRKK